jgi:Carboxypeptidase regulatory-like domain
MIFSMLLLLGLLHQVPEPGNACGAVQDRTGAAIPGATVGLRSENALLNISTDRSGQFCFNHLPPGPYELEIQAMGFQSEHRQVDVVSGESAQITVLLVVQGVTQRVTVEGSTSDVGATAPAHTNVSSSLIATLPSESVNASLSSVLTLATPGVAADSNGVFHPLGEHAETSFSVDGEPISDQQSRIFSNQISVSTIEEMEIIHGAPPAEYGDKTSLIVKATTRSGLDAGRVIGTFSLGYGSFDTSTAALTLSSGTKTIGNFLALEGVSSRRFLDAPEFKPLHARGNAGNFFDRVDLKPNDFTSYHLSFSAAHSWFQTPNTYDQQSAEQDQRQHMTSFNLGVGASHLFGPSALLTANAWFRQDRVNYYPTANPLADQPATLSQSRRLSSTGAKADLSYSHRRHMLKAGVQLQVTPLSEAFRTGLTDPAFNSPCVNAQGTPIPDPSLTNPSPCAALGFAANPSFQPGLLPYDLTRRGNLFQFRGGAKIYEESAYVQDSVKLGQLILHLGLRLDNYDGLSGAAGLQPRGGIAYELHPTRTVFRASYARVFLTPYNENLILSSATGPGGLANGSLGATSVQPLIPARRNQFNAGFEQQLGRKLSIEGEYFWKHTHGAYDFNVILNTPLNFPIQFRKAKIDGAMVRLSLNRIRGFSVFSVLGHTRSRLFSPEVGGINFGQPYAPVARPDHDQAFQQTTYLRYEFKPGGPWIAATWRFDSGLVVVSVPDYATALTLTGDEQQQIGLYCGNVFATVNQPLRSCRSPNFGATRIHIIPAGKYDPDRNPSRITPRNLFDIALGTGNIRRRDHYSIGAKLTVVNLMNRIALYNFLSTFSGTHFVIPRTIQAEIALHF